MQRKRGASPRVRLRLGPGGDPVVDDLEVGLGEALGLGEVAREAARDRDLAVRERADRAVAEREEAPLAELVEAVLGREPHRHAGERPGRLAVGVGVDEVRVQDRRPVVERGTRGRARTCRDRRRCASGSPSTGHAAGLELARELPRAGLLLVQHQEADVPAAPLAGPAAAASRCASEPEMPATFWTWRTIIASRHLEDTRRPSARPSGARLDARAQLVGRARCGPRREGARSFAREVVGVVAAEAQLGRQHVVEAAVRGEHGHARRRGLVDDLVERSLAHVVHEHVLAGEQRRDLRVADRAPRAATPSASSRARSARSSLGRRRPAHARGRRRRARPPGRSSRSPSPARCARARRTRRRAAGSRSTQANALECRSRARSRTTFARGERERAAVDGEHRGREPLGEHERPRAGFQCVNQSSSGTRRGRASGAARIASSGVMCTSTASGLAASARARALRRRAGRASTCEPEPNTTHAAVLRQRAVAPRGRRARRPRRTGAASARIFGTVAAEHRDRPGRPTCVTKTSRRSQEVQVAELEVRTLRQRAAGRATCRARVKVFGVGR